MKKLMLIAALVAGTAGLAGTTASAGTICGVHGCVHVHAWRYGYRLSAWRYGYRPYAYWGYAPRIVGFY